MADRKIEYASSASLTITLASLATSSTLVAGRESTSVSNTTNKYIDYLISGKITTGTSPTASKSIEIWVYGSLNDTPTYADVLDGTDSAETFTSRDILLDSCKLAARITTDNTSDRAYYFGPISVASMFNGSMPKLFGAFVVHDTGVNLNSTGGNHFIDYTGVYETIV